MDTALQKNITFIPCFLCFTVYLWKRRHCGGGCDAPTTCYEHGEKEVIQQVSLVVHPECDANKGPCDSHNPLTPTGTYEGGIQEWEV